MFLGKQKILKYFFQMDQENSRFNYTAIENYKTVWTFLTSLETAPKFKNANGPFAKKKIKIKNNKKKLRIFRFPKMLWLVILLPSAPVKGVVSTVKTFGERRYASRSIKSFESRVGPPKSFSTVESKRLWGSLLVESSLITSVNSFFFLKQTAF